MRRGGVITARRKMRERGKRIRRRAMAAGAVLLLCALAMSDQLRDRLSLIMQEGVGVVQTFAAQRTESIELELKEKEIYALQLGVFENGERAQSELQRLNAQGVPCVIWQRDKMRIICCVAARRDALDHSAAGGNDAYVVRDTLESVHLRLSCAAGDSAQAAEFVALPDRVLDELLDEPGRALEEILADVDYLSQKAAKVYPQNILYAGLAQSLLDWRAALSGQLNSPSARCYAAVTMCTLCREWRNALIDYALIAESTASAQRTPSTAAEVMPPAYPAPSPQG